MVLVEHRSRKGIAFELADEFSFCHAGERFEMLIDIFVGGLARTAGEEEASCSSGFDERNRDLIVSVAGRLTHRDQAAVSPFDSSVQGGDAVWEGLRLYHGPDLPAG